MFIIMLSGLLIISGSTDPSDHQWVSARVLIVYLRHLCVFESGILVTCCMQYSMSTSTV